MDGSFSGDTNLVFDSGNIVSISGNISMYPPQGHPILYNYCKLTGSYKDKDRLHRSYVNVCFCIDTKL